jgi:rhodanese-related sulfurtransferase
MKKLLSLIMVLAFIPMFLTTGCKKEEENKNYDVLFEYMKTNNLELSALMNGCVVGGSGINANKTDYSVPDYYVMDIRSAADFDKGHIKDAHNVAFTGILDEAAKAGGKKILVVCYTGQTAARAAILLRLAGFTAHSLKWGMASWNADLAGPWNTNAVDFTSPNWETTGTPPTLVEYSKPTIESEKTTGKEILDEQIKEALALPWNITKTDVLTNPQNYDLYNFWPLVSWDAYGHIKGSFRLYEDMKLDGLKYIDPASPSVVWCYTGQQSGMASAWLHVLGYTNAKGMLFGANGIVYNKLLTGTADAAPTKAWKGASSGSVNNFGYYDTAGTYYPPK